MRSTLTVCAVLFCVLLFGMALGFWLAPKHAFSEIEKRALERFPKPSIDAFWNGTYCKKTESYYADHLPGRTELVGLKARVELLLGKGENNGILLGRGGRLARWSFEMRTPNGETEQTDRYSSEQVVAACEGILRANDSLSVPFAVLLTGRNIDVYPSAFSYPIDHSDALNRAVQTALGDSVAAPDLISLFRASEGDLYYRTDHHWTTEGAYLGYRAAMAALGREEEILPANAFRRETVATDFYGTLWAASGMRWIQPDRIAIWLRGNEDTFTVTADGRELDGFYNLSRASGSDGYALFLDGTHDVVQITQTGTENRPHLLVLRDSFGSSVAPFLAQHYDLTLLNLSSTRQDFTDVSELAEEYRADAVLLVYTMENLLTANKLPRLH